MADVQHLGELVSFYFTLGLHQQEILECLVQNHQITISLRSLQRLLQKEGLYRRKNKTDILDIALFLENELDNYGQLHGYRFMHLKCIQKGYVVDHRTIMWLLQILDPDGVELRRQRRLRRRAYYSKGPNYIWHIDSYDKLKPYGICINGCVDGFSRKLIWLEAYTTNNDPRVIASYFLGAVRSMQGCPRKIRGDLGTENRFVEQMQKFLRRNHDDNDAGDKSFLYGSSNHNQRIESFWGHLRKQYIQYWMNIFQYLKNEDKFSGDFIDKNLIQFCFMNIIQEGLDQVAHLWNTHWIRSSKNQTSPHGRPVIMYTCPNVYGVDDYICRIDIVEVGYCEDESRPKGQYPCDETIFELCCIYMQENNWSPPTVDTDALRLYCDLRNLLHANI